MKVGEEHPTSIANTDWDECFAQLTGKPHLIHFWAMSCPACKGNMPHLQTLREKYAPEGLQVVAVHMPRGPVDVNDDRVRQVAQEIGVTESCLIDNDHAIGDAFQTGGVWPVYFLFGPDGKLKRHAAGGFGVKMMESALKKMFERTTTATETEQVAS